MTDQAAPSAPRRALEWMARLPRSVWEQYCTETDLSPLIRSSTDPRLLAVLLVGWWVFLALVTYAPGAHGERWLLHACFSGALAGVGFCFSWLAHRAKGTWYHILNLLDYTFWVAGMVWAILALRQPTSWIFAGLMGVDAVRTARVQGWTVPHAVLGYVLPAAAAFVFVPDDLVVCALFTMGLMVYMLVAYPISHARRRQAVEEAAARARLEESARLATLGRLGASLAHEMSGPLLSIRGFAERLEREGFDGPKDELAAITTAARQLHRVVQQVRLIGSPQRAEHEALVASQPVDDALLLMGRALRSRGVELEWEPPADPPRVLGDRARLAQVVVNLLVNARDALADRPDGSRRTIRLGLEAADGVASLVVEDDGPGVRPEDEARLFDAFFTTKDRPDGIGLGLAISADIAREHGGELAYERREGGGARFRLDLPRLAEEG